MSKEDNTNLYEVLQRGDRQIASTHPSAILLVGLTRAGKSTTFNWILNKLLRGVIDEDDIIAHYVNAVETGTDSAELGNTFTSVTLCPNAVELDKARCISLIDMAGYKDKRDYIGVLGVSYFLKAVFERVKRVKFLIVLGEDKLIENSGDGIIDTFSGFLNMFNVHLMDANSKQDFYSSISIIVTRSEQETRHQAYFRKILKMIKDPKLNVEKRDQLVNLIEYLINENRIEPFKVAQANKGPVKCTLVERFNDQMGWRFFDIEKTEQAIGKELIFLPFQKDYKSLKEDQRKKFDTEIARRVNSYLQFSKILNTLIRSIQSNWNNCVDQWQLRYELSLNLTHYEEVFAHVRNFLDLNDFYHSEKLVVPDIKVEYGSLNLVQTLRKVLEIYTIADTIGDQTETFLKNMDAYTVLFSKLIDCLLAFATSAETEHLLLRLKFIIKRGFRQFSKLYQINPNIIHDVSQKMKDNCSSIFKETRKEFIERFIVKIDTRLMRRLFSKVDELLDYEMFFNDYEYLYRKDYKETIFFSEHRSSLQMAKAVLFLLDDKKRQALRCYINAFKCICEIAYQTSRSFKVHEEIEIELNALYMKKLAMIEGIAALLKDFKEVPEARVYALILSTHVRNINDACEIYELMINESTDPSTKLEKIGEYSDYCLDWGRYEKATALLQWKLKLEKDSFQNYMITIRKMTEVAKNQIKYLEKYQENLANWARLPQEDSVLNGYLQELEFIIPEA